MPLDIARDAEELAQRFFNLSNAVDDFRLRHFGELSAAERLQLKEQAQALATRGQGFTAEALGAILQDIQPHLAKIMLATQDAQDALAHLNNVVKAIAIVDSAVALVGSIAAGDVSTIGGNVQGLFQAIES